MTMQSIDNHFNIFYRDGLNSCIICGQQPNVWEMVNLGTKKKCTHVWCESCSPSSDAVKRKNAPASAWVRDEDYELALRKWNELNINKLNQNETTVGNRSQGR